MKNILFAIFIFILTTTQAQERYSLNGVIKDLANNETLYGVTIVFPDLNTGTTSNEYGFYAIKLPPGKHRMLISYIGFQEIELEVDMNSNVTRNIDLLESSEALEEVVISQNS